MIFRDGFLISTFLATAAVFLFLLFLWRRGGKKEPIEWPIAAATVEEVCSGESEDSEDSGDSPPKYTSGVIYSYKVSGEIYRGMYDWPELYDSPEEARAKVKHRIGVKIQVQYDPQNPQYSILDE